MPKAKATNAGKGKARGRRNTPRSPSPSPDNDAVQEKETIEVTEEETPSVEIPKDSDLPSDSSMPSTQKLSQSKKPKKSCRLRDEQEEGQVLEWIAEHPCLWNLKNKDYKNKALKDRLWEEKAEELQYDGKFKYINLNL